MLFEKESLFGQTDIPALSHHERYAHLFFEPMDRTRECRLRNTQHIRRTGNVLSLSDHKKVSKLIEIHV